MPASKKLESTEEQMSSTEPNLVPKQDPQEDVLDVLAEFESGLESLKALYSQRQRLQNRIRQHEEEVQKREVALNEKTAELTQSTAAFQQRQQELEASLAKLQSREAELEATVQALAEERAALEASRGKLDEETHARGKSLEAQAHKLAQESRAVENLTHELEQQARALDEQRAAFEQERATRAEDLAEIEKLRKDLAAQRQTLGSHEKQSRELQAKVDALGHELNQARELAAQHAKAAEQAASQTTAITSKHSHDAAQLKQQLEQHAKALAKATQDAQSQAAASKSHIEQLQLRATQFETQNKDLSKAAETARAQAAAAQAELEQLQQKSAQLEQQSREFAKNADSTKSASAAMQAQVAQLQSRAAEFEKALSQEKAETSRLTAALAQQTESAAAMAKTLEGLNTKLKHELAEREEMRRQIEAAQAGLMQATTRSNQLEAQLAKALNEVKALQTAAATKPKAVVSSSNASMLRRRARLKLAHGLIRERYHKLGKANEALKKRIEQCDQIMGQRQELAGIRDRVILAERASLRKQAGSRALVMVLCAAAVFAILGGLSWAVARELAPATYLATSMIAADGRGRALNQQELAEWQTFHQGLLEDPRFHETVADRFKKQGMATLGSAPAVADLIRNNLTTESAKVGQLSLHLKDKGSDRTQRELETFTAAFVSHANAAQQQRIDGSVTEVGAPATAGMNPIDNTVTLYAGAFLAVGVVLAALLWTFLWKRLVGAKTAFESDADIAAALDDAKWNNFASAGAAAQVAQKRAR